jgi:hypothetical protein
MRLLVIDIFNINFLCINYMDNVIEYINQLDDINDLTNILVACQIKINKLESIDVASRLKQCNAIKCLGIKQLNVINTINNIYYDTSFSYKHASSKIKFSINNVLITCVYDQGDASLTVGDIKVVEYDSYSIFQNLHHSIINYDVEKVSTCVNLSAKEYIEMVVCIIDTVITGKYKLKK